MDVHRCHQINLLLLRAIQLFGLLHPLDPLQRLYPMS